MPTASRCAAACTVPAHFLTVWVWWVQCGSHSRYTTRRARLTSSARPCDRCDRRTGRRNTQRRGSSDMRFDTRLVQVGQEPDKDTGDVVPAIHVAATYERRVQDPLRYFYARGESPTREALERCLASLEDARFAMVFPSGQSAAATALALPEPGARGSTCDDVYGGTYSLFRTLRRYEIQVDYVDL